MAKPLQKDRENRSAEKKDLTFHPYNITPETAKTAVLLLESTEPEILCQTLRSLTKFAAQDIANRYVLFDLNAITYIAMHIEHPELNVKRFALKALAQLCQLPRGPEQVLANPQNIRKVSFILSKMEDVFILEFASLILAELTKEPLGCEYLISCNILSTLFARMKNSLDPDVQKNCLQTLSNLLDDPVSCSEVTKNPQFSWPSLLVLMSSKFLAIQDAALKTVDKLICRFKDQVVQRSFKASTGVTDLCDILESYEFRDVHAQVLGVLKDYVETEENACHVYQCGALTRLLQYLEVAMPIIKPHCVAVLSKMSYTAGGREALFGTGTDLVFCHHMQSTSSETLADAASGIANMTKLLPSAYRMADTNIIELIVWLLGDDAVPWFNVRLNSLKVLCELVRLVPKAAFAAIDPKTFGIIRNINKRYKDYPIEAQRMALQCCINMCDYALCVKGMLHSDYLHEILNILGRIDTLAKIRACTLLTILCNEDAAKHLFTKVKGEEVVSETLPVEHVGLRTALCTLIVASVTEDGADAYLDLGTIHYMVENKQARYVVPAWEPAIEAIFRCHPSAKFAYTGRLDITDFSQEGFYVQKRIQHPFPTLGQLLAEPLPHKQPVLMCMFYPSPFDSGSAMDIRAPHSEGTKSNLNMSASSRIRFASIPDDVNLRAYLLRLRIWLGDPGQSLTYLEVEDAFYDVRLREKCNEVASTLKHKAQLLAEFVTQQMCGTDQERDCAMPSVDLHMGDLMLELKSCVVGIGWVRCGGPLERAVLYKVLADRLGLPCALFRTTSAHAWCEVAVPENDPGQEHDPEPYPAGLLRCNYVVDLESDPSRLVPRGSPEARRVCGPACAPMYTARNMPDACRCDDGCH